MTYSAKIICDHIGPSGKRLTTFEATYPKFVHNELMTHRALSRNTASSRAIPYEKTRQVVIDDPVIPVWWGKNQKGMQAREELTGEALDNAMQAWVDARHEAVIRADILHSYGVHKQLVNRVIEPWMWITAIITATEWSNFWYLRCNPDAQPEMQKIATMMRDLYFSSSPVEVGLGYFHLPYVRAEDWTEVLEGNDWFPNAHQEAEGLEKLCSVSVARCARVSYLTPAASGTCQRTCGCTGTFEGRATGHPLSTLRNLQMTSNPRETLGVGGSTVSASWTRTSPTMHREVCTSDFGLVNPKFNRYNS